MNSRGHGCGCYFIPEPTSPARRQRGIYTVSWLPQVSLKAHTTILSTTSRTELTQTFQNTSPSSIKKATYTFPLYDGVSVVGFRCKVGSRIIKGVVKEKEKARQVFNEAVAKGETAGLMEQLPEASDTFQTTIGNIAAGQTVEIQITYLGELKHDAEADAIRFTLPHAIASRYGGGPSSNGLPAAADQGLELLVDVVLSEKQPIRGVQSPSHPLAVTLGNIAANASSNDFTSSKASATLSRGSLDLGADFVLLVQAQNIINPTAILEAHPTIQNQRALMVSLVPKFALKPARPEIVFVVDRSGSMYDKVDMLKSALQVFLKSLPLGVKFNICSFGSSHSLLWPKSYSYDGSTLDEAMGYVSKIQADMGGTEMLAPIRAVIGQRYKDIPLDVMVLTDGEIWNQKVLFDYLNEARASATSPLRVFSLGIGRDVSHSLVEGIARAGDGFAQVVTPGEKLDAKIVRMLKGALSPHITDYAMEIVYSQEDADEDGDIERITEGLRVLARSPPPESGPEPAEPISLFDPDTTEVEEDASLAKNAPPDYDGMARFSHLPIIPVPKYIQAPVKIPSLFPFSRSLAYVLLSPYASHKVPRKVVLTGTSPQGPLRLEIPVELLPEPGETIHQLAAKKAVLELEEGRGWLNEAKDEGGVPIKERFESRFDDMVQREAVRLGVEFQMSGKWCSFVAVRANEDEEKERQRAKEKDMQKSDLSFSASTSSLSQRERDSSPLPLANQGSTQGTFEGEEEDESDDDMGFRLDTPEPVTDDSASVASSAVSTGTFVSRASSAFGGGAPQNYRVSLASANAPPSGYVQPQSGQQAAMMMNPALVQQQQMAMMMAQQQQQQQGMTPQVNRPGEPRYMMMNENMAMPKPAPPPAPASARDRDRSVRRREQKSIRTLEDQVVWSGSKDSQASFDGEAASGASASSSTFGSLGGMSATPDQAAQINETVSQMKANIEAVITRGERLDSLDDKSGNLAASAQAFKAAATKKKRTGVFTLPDVVKRMMGSSEEQEKPGPPPPILGSSSPGYGSAVPPPPPGSSASVPAPFAPVYASYSGTTTRTFGCSVLADQEKYAADPRPLMDQEGSDDEETKQFKALPLLYKLIRLQTFEGYWLATSQLPKLWQLSVRECKPGLEKLKQESSVAALSGNQSLASRAWFTLLAIAFFRNKLQDEYDTWELIVDKAENWLDDIDGFSGPEKEKWEKEAEALICSKG